MKSRNVYTSSVKSVITSAKSKPFYQSGSFQKTFSHVHPKTSNKEDHSLTQDKKFSNSDNVAPAHVFKITKDDIATCGSSYKFLIPIVLSNGHSLSALVDTGAQSSLINNKIYSSLAAVGQVEHADMEASFVLKDFNNRPIDRIAPPSKIHFSFQGDHFHHIFHVVEAQTEVLLGLDFLFKYGADLRLRPGGNMFISFSNHVNTIQKIKPIHDNFPHSLKGDPFHLSDISSVSNEHRASFHDRSVIRASDKSAAAALTFPPATAVRTNTEKNERSNINDSNNINFSPFSSHSINELTEVDAPTNIIDSDDVVSSTSYTDYLSVAPEADSTASSTCPASTDTDDDFLFSEDNTVAAASLQTSYAAATPEQIALSSDDDDDDDDLFSDCLSVAAATLRGNGTATSSSYENSSFTHQILQDSGPNSLTFPNNLEKNLKTHTDEDFLSADEDPNEDQINPVGYPACLGEDDPPLIDWEHEIRSNSSFPPELLEDFIHFIKTETPDLISKHELDIGRLADHFQIKHEIPTHPGTIPMSRKPYKLNPIRADQMRRTMNQLESLGVIEKANSPYAAPTFFVAKRDGRLRCCFDVCDLNAATVKQSFPLRRIEDILQEIGSSKADTFTLIDITAAYNNIEMSEDASYKAAIITPEAQYRVKRLSFGYSGAPSTFSRAMDAICSRIPPDEKGIRHTVFYLDDLCIFSDRASHLTHVKNACRALHEAGLKIHLHKAFFFKEELELLGRRITRWGSKPLNRHIKALQDFPRPYDVKSLQRFLGLVAWQSSYIPRYSQITAPLNYLLRKEVPWVWSNEQERLFLTLKAIITERTQTYFCDFSSPIYLNCNASLHSFAAWLYQVRTYDLKDKDNISQALGDLTSLNDLQEQFQDKTSHPVLPMSGKTVPKPFILPFDNKSSSVPPDLSVTDFHDPEKFHVIFPIAFYSSNFNKTQLKWTTMEKEMYAFLQSLRHFRTFVESSPEVYVLTDNSTFLWSAKLAMDNNFKIARWMMHLSALPIRLIVTHIKGKFNDVPDALSRAQFWAVPEKPEPNAHKKAYRITNLWFPGDIISLDTLQEKVQENPDLVTPVSEFPSQPSKQINFVGTSQVKELMSMLDKVNIITHQQSDDFCKKVISNLHHSSHSESRFFLHQGILYKLINPLSSSSEPLSVIVIPSSLIGPCIAMMHMENHSGTSNLLNQIRRLYYFKNMQEEIANFVSGCHLCAVFKADKTGKPTMAENTIWPAAKFAVWSIDVVSGFPSHKHTGQYLSAIEYHSSFKLIIPLKSATGDEIATILEQRIISVFGPPRMFLSDSGSNLLLNQKIIHLCLLYNIHRHITTPYAPFTHGFIETSHSYINNLLRTLLHQLDLPWHKLCALAQISLNTASCKALGGYSPYFFMFGINPDKLTQKELKISDFPDAMELQKTWRIHQELCNKITAKLAKERAERNKKLGGRIKMFNINDWVYIKDFRIIPKMKIKERYEHSPYKVLRVFGKVLIVKNLWGITKKVHVANVKKFSECHSYLFENLPLSVKLCLGDSLSIDNLERHPQDKMIPDIYKSQVQGPTLRETRKIAKTLEAQDKISISDPLVFDDEELLFQDDNLAPYTADDSSPPTVSFREPLEDVRVLSD
jgi:hypothetical protein